MRVWLQSRKKPVNMQTINVPQGENRPSVTVLKASIWWMCHLSLRGRHLACPWSPAYVMLREGWDRGFPGEVSTLILPQGKRLNSVIFRCSDYLPLAANFYITWFLPSPSQNSSSTVTWDAASQAWSPKNSHQIKYNSISIFFNFCF